VVVVEVVEVVEVLLIPQLQLWVVVPLLGL
jgi:hypothetical protein